ncbi:MAG TPA: molybdate ABC transporter substrate-binding protein [Planctomycetaceae bacterium]|jgi:molybdate transport system substrate-binding protein
MTIASILLPAFFLAGCGTETKVSDTNRPAPAAKTDARQRAQPETATKGNGQLRIAAASDLKFALEEVRNKFASLHPGSTITLTYGSSGSFFAQLANEAPFDLFLAADLDYARRLVKQGQGAPQGDFTYARGHVVVWVSKDSPYLVEKPGIEFLREAGVQKIAIANPKTAPYGRAAVAALESLKVYDAVEPKLVYGENVAQAAQMVESGAADAGLIALSLAVSPNLRDKGRHWQVPDGAYPPLVQAGVILRWVQDPALANEFRDFLLSSAGTTILKQFGFDEP